MSWSAAGRALERALPERLRAVLEQAAEHHTMTLAAGLAFFGLLSFAPAVGPHGPRRAARSLALRPRMFPGQGPQAGQVRPVGPFVDKASEMCGRS